MCFKNTCFFTFQSNYISVTSYHQKSVLFLTIMKSFHFYSVDNKRRTKHIARTLNPEWNETVVFPDVHIEELRNKTLEVTVWDYDRFKANDFLGEVVIDFSGNISFCIYS